jgi:hypothetical protein
MHSCRVSAVLWLLVIVHAQASAQESASIDGTVVGPNEEMVRYAPIQATNVETGEKVRSESAKDGTYSISNLVTGAYKLEVNMPCCAYKGFESDEISVAGATQLNIELEEGSSFNTVGDDPGVIATAIKDRQVIPEAPVPRLPSGKPDLSGVWLLGSDPFPEQPDAMPWAQELLEERIASNFRQHPHNYCLPGGPPITGGAAPFIAKFVHKEGLLIILLEDVGGYRQVFLDGREHPEWPNPTWFGHSIGYWEGDVLVVDTVGFNDRGWTSGYPRSEELHMIESYTRTDYGRLEQQVTFEDPQVFNKPWSENAVLDLAPQEELIEYVCENNKWTPTDSP